VDDAGRESRQPESVESNGDTSIGNYVRAHGGCDAHSAFRRARSRERSDLHHGVLM